MNKPTTPKTNRVTQSYEPIQGNEWGSDPSYDFLGHSSELKELDEQGIGEIVQRIADNSKIADQFKDIKILHSNQDNFIACVDVRTGVIYLNASNKLFTPAELIKGVNGLMNHESLHLNNWLGIPGNAKRALKHHKAVKRFKTPNNPLDWLYDLEAHYHASHGFLSPIQQLELREFITITREKMLKLNPKSPILSMEQPKTKLQKDIKKIVSNRSKTFMQKAKIISKLLDDNNYPNNPQPGDGQPQKGNGKSNKGNGQGQGSPSKGNKNSSEATLNDPNKGNEQSNSNDSIVITKIIGDSKEDREWLEKQLKECHSESLTHKIEEEKEYRNLQQQIQKHGISAGNTKDVINYFKDNGWVVDNVKALNRCLKDMLGFDSGFLKKLKETSPRIGYRMNGYRRARDIQETAQSIESLITDGIIDINDVRVPDLISRKRKGIMIIIRDVSGSVLRPPVDRVVRDATMVLIAQAKKEKHKVAVLDFAVGAEFIPDHLGKPLTENHENLLCKSVYLKGGGGTQLEDAITALNKLIDTEHLKDTPINIYVITDSFIDGYDAHAMKINANKFTLTGIVYNDRSGDFVYDPFKHFIQLNEGKSFFIELSVDKKLISGLKSISPGGN